MGIPSSFEAGSHLVPFPGEGRSAPSCFRLCRQLLPVREETFLRTLAGWRAFLRGLESACYFLLGIYTFVCEFRRKGKIKGRERETWSVVRNTLVDTVACPLLIPAKSSLTMQTIILGDNTNVDLLFSEICQRSSILLYPRRSQAVP